MMWGVNNLATWPRQASFGTPLAVVLIKIHTW
jgi:hypothetical protein